MPITWGVKKYKHRECVFLNSKNPSHTSKGRSFYLDRVSEGGGKKGFNSPEKRQTAVVSGASALVG